MTTSPPTPASADAFEQALEAYLDERLALTASAKHEWISEGARWARTHTLSSPPVSNLIRKGNALIDADKDEDGDEWIQALREWIDAREALIAERDKGGGV